MLTIEPTTDCRTLLIITYHWQLVTCYTCTTIGWSYVFNINTYLILWDTVRLRDIPLKHSNNNSIYSQQFCCTLSKKQRETKWSWYWNWTDFTGPWSTFIWSVELVCCLWSVRINWPVTGQNKLTCDWPDWPVAWGPK
jgi:hypothetical protein